MHNSNKKSKKVGRPRNMNKYNSSRGCTRQYTKKYKSRPSPPYPANLCRLSRKKGNDGHMYKSVSAKNKGKVYFKWKKI